MNARKLGELPNDAARILTSFISPALFRKIIKIICADSKGRRDDLTDVDSRKEESAWIVVSHKKLVSPLVQSSKTLFFFFNYQSRLSRNFSGSKSA